MPSGSWLVCPSCDLKHSPRPDGRCPRCRAEVVPPSDAPGAALRPAASAEHPRFPRDAGALGPRIAGGVLVLGGIVSAFSTSAREAAPGVTRVAPAAGALVAILLGIWLLRGSDLARRLAVGLVAFALAGTVAAGAVTNTWAVTAVLGALCGATLLLLLGEPGRGRIAAAGLVFAAALVAGIAGLPGMAPVLRTLLVSGGTTEGDPVKGASGPAWSLSVPPNRWYRARNQSFELTDAGDRVGQTSHAVFESRLLRVEEPAHLVVVSLRIAGSPGLDLDAAAARLADSASRRLERWRLLGVGTLPGRGGTRVLHATAVLERQEVEMLWGLYPNAPMFYVVLVAAERQSFPRLRGELEGILASFRSETLPREPAPR
jgi:hypothetical protein